MDLFYLKAPLFLWLGLALEDEWFETRLRCKRVENQFELDDEVLARFEGSMSYWTEGMDQYVFFKVEKR